MLYPLLFLQRLWILTGFMNLFQYIIRIAGNSREQANTMHQSEDKRSPCSRARTSLAPTMDE
jgi:hypothetical protein